MDDKSIRRRKIVAYGGKNVKKAHLIRQFLKGVVPIARYTKRFKEEWAFFFNKHGRLEYAEKCKLCEHDCKQSFRAVVMYCPYYLYKDRKRKEMIE